MFIGISDRVAPALSKLRLFTQEVIIPNEKRYEEELAIERWREPPVMSEMKARAREEGLSKLFLNAFDEVEYAHLAEAMGMSEIAAEVFNCAAPDSGNMSLLAHYGNERQQEQWLQALIQGEVRSGFAMTESAVASSDVRNIATSATKDKDSWIINGEKSWVSGAGDPNCDFLITLCVTGPNKEQSILIVPMSSPGLKTTRMNSIFGYDNAPHGHAQIQFKNVRIPLENLVGNEGQGLEIAQDRLGSGRVHQCMRSIGAAERALQLMVERSKTRFAFGKPLSELGGNVDVIANSRIEIEMSRLMALKAAYQIDSVGMMKSLLEIAQMKVAVPNMALAVIDRAIQMYGGMGLSEDTPLAKMWASHRALRLSDGPDEVHRELIARIEMGSNHQPYV
ncbi:MAG: acyl-CoA dehydrogenase [Candidatus Azotimanducaceae bacterium]|jgi:acyl-CoA dehydrogenase